MCRSAAVTVALVTLCCQAQSPAVDYELKALPDCPVVFSGDGARAPAPGVPRRQFVTVKSQAHKTVSGLILQQSLAHEQKTEIVTMEHVAIMIPPGETRRISFAVSDMAAKLQSSAAKPVLAVVAVEFSDASTWNAPTGVN